MFLEQKEMSVLPERCSKAFTKMLESLPRVWKALSSEETLKALHKGSHRPSDRLLSAAAVEGQSEKRCLRHDLRRHTQADAVPCRQRLAVGAHKAKALYQVAIGGGSTQGRGTVSGNDWRWEHTRQRQCLYRRRRGRRRASARARGRAAAPRRFEPSVLRDSLQLNGEAESIVRGDHAQLSADTR